LETVLQGLHESEIRCGIQNEPPAGGITAWIDYGNRTEKATFYGTIVGDQQVWPAADRIAAWMHETALAFPTMSASELKADCATARQNHGFQIDSVRRASNAMSYKLADAERCRLDVLSTCRSG
jgi:hypothetical protein